MSLDDDDIDYEEEYVLDEDLPSGFQVYDSPEEYAIVEETEDSFYNDDDDIQDLLAQVYQRDYGAYD